MGYSTCWSRDSPAHHVEDHCGTHFHMALCGDSQQDAAAMESTCQSKLLKRQPMEGSPQASQQELWCGAVFSWRASFDGMEPHWRSSSRTVSSRRDTIIFARSSVCRRHNSVIPRPEPLQISVPLGGYPLLGSFFNKQSWSAEKFPGNSLNCAFVNFWGELLLDPLDMWRSGT